MMKCANCGFENKDGAKFCTKCGQPLTNKSINVSSNSDKNKSKYVIIALLAIIVILIAAIGFFVLNGESDDVSNVAYNSNNISDALKSSNESESQQIQSTKSISSSQMETTQVSQSKSWVSIGSYSGSGSGSQTIDVPPGKIMVKLSAYPIKNYATNHLYVDGSNGASGGVDWGSKSSVETRSDSFTYESSSSETFVIDYYETVSWEVEFFSYQ